jgi:polysaccharide biosynthesis protein PslG
MNKMKVQHGLILRITVLIATFLVSLVLGNSTAQAQLPSGPFPSGLGVNDHNIEETLPVLQQMYSIGIRYLRIDLTWSTIEKTKGVYTFSSFDPLVANATQAGIKMLFILDYTNPLYDGGYSPDDLTGINAFAAYAVAAVAHYQGKGVIWEIYNEPTEFWSTNGVTYTHWTDASAIAPLYYNLASATATAIKNAYPNETVVGPADASFDSLLQPNGQNSYTFVQTLLQDGLGDQLNAVSVHPYRTTNPESAQTDYAWLQGQIGTYTATDPAIITSEWGYSSCYYNSNTECASGGTLTYTEAEVQKANYIVRAILTDVSSPTPNPLHIIYDWMDDGTDQGNSEDNYGLVENYNPTSPTITPLPAYYAVDTMTTQLTGYNFVKQISTGNNTDYVLEFSNGASNRYACWNSSGETNSVNIPVGSNMAVTVTSYNGNSSGTVTSVTTTSGASGYSCVEQAYPQYIALLAASKTTVTSSPSGSSAAGDSVTLAAAISSQNGSATPTGSVQFTVGSTGLGSAQLSSGVATLAVTTLPVGVDTVTATYSGDTTYSSSSGTVQITVTQGAPAVPNFTLSSTPDSLTVSSGGRGTVTLTLTPTNGFNSAVNFACSGLAVGVSCAFNPTSVTPSGAATTTTLTITGQTLTSNHRLNLFPQGVYVAFSLCFVGWKKRRNLQLVLLAAVVFAGLSLLSGCGGGSAGSASSGGGGVTPEISTVTVTATSGSIQQTAAITLTVN